MVAPGCAKRYPASGSTSPAAMRRRVDLPEPLRPTRQTRSPAATASSTPESRGVTPKVRLMSCSRSNGGAMTKEISRDRCGWRIVSICQNEGTALGGVEMTRLMHVFTHRPTLRSPAKRAVGDVRPPDDRGDGPHDERFHNALPNTDPLGWVTERRPGPRYADLLFPDAERRLVIAKAS